MFFWSDFIQKESFENSRTYTNTEFKICAGALILNVNCIVLLFELNFY